MKHENLNKFKDSFSDYTEYTYKNLAGLGIFNYIDIVYEDVDTTFTPLDMTDSTREIAVYIEDKWNLTPSIMLA